MEMVGIYFLPLGGKVSKRTHLGVLAVFVSSCWKNSKRIIQKYAAYKSAPFITGLVTFIDVYYYMCIFNLWTNAYIWDANSVTPTDISFNDAYRYKEHFLSFKNRFVLESLRREK